jgi:hypothetical protein
MNNPIKQGSLLYLLLYIVLYKGFGQPAIPITKDWDYLLARIQPTIWSLFLKVSILPLTGGWLASSIPAKSWPEVIIKIELL